MAWDEAFLAAIEEAAYRGSLRAGRVVQGETWISDEDMARSLRVSPRSWRAMYEGDPALLALAQNLGTPKRRILRWRLADVDLYFEQRGRR